MCSVDLSDVQASMVPDGLKAREKMVAVSMPRRSSTRRAQLLVEKMRIRVPYWRISEFFSKVAGMRKLAYGSTYRLTCRCEKLAI